MSDNQNLQKIINYASRFTQRNKCFLNCMSCMHTLVLHYCVILYSDKNCLGMTSVSINMHDLCANMHMNCHFYTCFSILQK